MTPTATVPKEFVKVSVLASGEVLYEGSPVTLEQLGENLKGVKERGAGVWYYREAAGNPNPPEAAKAVLQMIVANKLAISMSSQADFSDWVDGQGISHPRAGTAGGDAVGFEAARKHAAASRHLVIVRPDRKSLLVPVPPAGSMPESAVKAVEAMVPSKMKRNVAAIADTSFVSGEKPGIAEAGRAIPFFGLLLGFGYIGHSVWIFEAGPAVTEGCRGADVLVVDSAVLPKLPQGWEKDARAVMRSPNIIVQDRATQKFIALKQAG